MLGDPLRGVDITSHLPDLYSTRAHLLLHPKGVRLQVMPDLVEMCMAALESVQNLTGTHSPTSAMI